MAEWYANKCTCWWVNLHLNELEGLKGQRCEKSRCLTSVQAVFHLAESRSTRPRSEEEERRKGAQMEKRRTRDASGAGGEMLK